MTTKFGRRQLLQSLAVSATVAIPGTALAAAPQRRFFKRTGCPIGLQLYTLGDEVGRNLDGTLTKLAAMGCRDLELPGLYGRKPAELRSAADRAGVRYSCIHIPLVSSPLTAGAMTLSSPAQEVADALGILGVRQVVQPMFVAPQGFQFKPSGNPRADLIRAFSAVGPDHWKRSADLLNRRAAALKPFGITVGYHNHNVEFMSAKETGWEILARDLDPALVFFEIDVGWVAAAGIDPIAFLKKYRGRVSCLHVKDLKASTKPNNVLEMDPSEVGSGKLDWARLLPAAYDAGTRHFYIEQEAPFAVPRMDAVAKSVAYLSKLEA